jgi:acylphosphatase
MDTHKIVRVLILGRVQGVWYRRWTVEAATARGIHGWVRNRSDGSVEAVFSGPDFHVDALIEACRQGPPAAQVSEIRQEPWTEKPEPGFHQRATL